MILTAADEKEQRSQRFILLDGFERDLPVPQSPAPVMTG